MRFVLFSRVRFTDGFGMFRGIDDIRFVLGWIIGVFLGRWMRYWVFWGFLRLSGHMVGMDFDLC